MEIGELGDPGVLWIHQGMLQGPESVTTLLPCMEDKHVLEVPLKHSQDQVEFMRFMSS